MERIDTTLQKVLKSPTRFALSSVLSRNECKLVELLGELAINRATRLSPEEGAIALKNISRLDESKFCIEDVIAAFADLAENRDEFESAWPAWKTMREAIERAERRRTQAQRQSEANARYAALVAHADKIRQEREAEWKAKHRRSEISPVAASVKAG